MTSSARSSTLWALAPAANERAITTARIPCALVLGLDILEFSRFWVRWVLVRHLSTDVTINQRTRARHVKNWRRGPGRSRVRDGPGEGAGAGGGAGRREWDRDPLKAQSTPAVARDSP